MCVNVKSLHVHSMGELALSLNLYSSKFIVPYILKLFNSVKVTKFLISEYCEHCEKVYT